MTSNFTYKIQPLGTGSNFTPFTLTKKSLRTPYFFYNKSKLNNRNKLNKYSYFDKFVNEKLKMEETRYTSKIDNNVIIYYPSKDADDRDISVLEELTKLYVDKYNLAYFNLEQLPEYHNDLLKVSGENYEEIVEGTHYIADDEELQYFLNKRLSDFPKCIKQNPKANYYNKEYAREQKISTQSVNNRCAKALWGKNAIKTRNENIDGALLSEFVAQLTDINILKTFVNPDLFKDLDDRNAEHNKIFFDRVVKYYSRPKERNLYFMQFVFSFWPDQKKIFGDNLLKLTNLYKRMMEQASNYMSCSRFIDWSVLLNNLVTKCMSRNKLALFPIMFILPIGDYKGIDIPFTMKDAYPINIKTVFGPHMKFVGIINMIHKYDDKYDVDNENTNFAEKYSKTKLKDYQVRFWTFYVFQKSTEVRHGVNHFSGNIEEYLLLNINGNIVNHGDLFGQVPITYLELNQLTQKHNMNCFLKEITRDIDGESKQIGLLFMTPSKVLNPMHTRVIELLKLEAVDVIKNTELIGKAPSHSFIIKSKNSS